MSEPPQAPEPSSAQLLRRLLALAWRYRQQCIAVFAYQVVLLALGVFGLGLSGLAIDLLRHALVWAPPPRRTRGGDCEESSSAASPPTWTWCEPPCKT